MRIKRYVIACSVLFVLSLAWNALIHLVLLRHMDASVSHLRRPDFADKMWLSFLLTAALACLFVWGYSRIARNGSIREGALYGLFIALLAGLLVDLNQYVLYPIPASVAAAWFACGLVEFTLYGILISRLLPPKPDRSAIALQ